MERSRSGKSLAEALAELTDPRRKQRRVHEWVPLLLMSVSAMGCGAKSRYAIGQWGQERLEDSPEVLESLGLQPGRSPSVAPLHRVFKRLKGEEFEGILGQWIAQCLDVSPEGKETPKRGEERAPAAVIAIDGKSLRGIHGEEILGKHLVSAYQVAAGAVIGQEMCQGKGQELAAVRALLENVGLIDRVVVGDALQTQRDLCQTIVSKGGTTASR